VCGRCSRGSPNYNHNDVVKHRTLEHLSPAQPQLVHVRRQAVPATEEKSGKKNKVEMGGRSPVYIYLRLVFVSPHTLTPHN
jgi:hypothetical protein